MSYTRRHFLESVSAVGAASLLGFSRLLSAEPPLEVKKIRLVHTPAICRAPEYLAEALLRAEGFESVEFIKSDGDLIGPTALAEGMADITMWDAPGTIPALDSGKPIVVLAGIHAGCYELFVHEPVSTIRDLKNKTISVYAMGGGDHILMASILAYIGLDPRKDVKWLAGPGGGNEAMQNFLLGKSDGFLGFAPQPQELRAKKIGKVILNTAQDRPWSQYFCCIVSANRTFASRYPVATKRALRAFLKAADLCSQQPEQVARYLVEKGFEPRYEIGLEVLKSLPYDGWRRANPEDTIRFLSLRLHEVGMIKSTPQKLIAQGTDWRFLNELKKELKA